jgi:thiol-disulfide isomerase/thioredoxin
MIKEKNMELVIFKSPTCGPCKLFAPQCKQAADTLNINYREVDVTNEDGVKEAKKFSITSSGIALLLDNGNEVLRFDRPCPATMLIDCIKAKL